MISSVTCATGLAERHAVVAARRPRSACRTATRDRARPVGKRAPTGCSFSVPVSPTGTTGHAGGQREVGDAGAAAVEAAVAGAGALAGRCRTPRRGRAPRARCRGWRARPRGSSRSTGQHPDALEPQPAGSVPLSAGAGEVVGLGQEGDLARRDDRDHQRSRRSSGGCWPGSPARSRGTFSRPRHRRSPDQPSRPAADHRVQDRVHDHPTQSSWLPRGSADSTARCHGRRLARDAAPGK